MPGHGDQVADARLINVLARVELGQQLANHALRDVGIFFAAGHVQLIVAQVNRNLQTVLQQTDVPVIQSKEGKVIVKGFQRD